MRRNFFAPVMINENKASSCFTAGFPSCLLSKRNPKVQKISSLNTWFWNKALYFKHRNNPTDVKRLWWRILMAIPPPFSSTLFSQELLLSWESTWRTHLLFLAITALIFLVEAKYQDNCFVPVFFFSLSQTQKKQLSVLGHFCIGICFWKAHNRLLLTIISVSHFPRHGLSQAGGRF